MRQASPHRQHGVSLVEVAIASVILALCGVLLLGVIDRQAKVAGVDRSMTLVERAHDALLAYAYLHHGLPCPSQVTTGVESCDGKDDGYLAYITLGLPDPAAGRLRYRMAPDLRSPASSSPYRVVTSRRTGDFGDLQAQVVPLASLLPAGHEMLFDLCEALGSPSGSARTAYELGMEADKMLAAGNAPTSLASSVMTDVVGRSQLAAKLQCGTLAVAGRAHFNAALAADTMNRAIEDILAQAVLVKETNAVDLEQGLYFFLNSTYSLYRANTKRLGALATFQASNSTDSRALSVAKAKTAMAGAYTAAMATNVARFSINLARAKAREKTLTDLRTQADRAASEIRTRALVGGSSAFFLEDKWSAPAP